MGLDVYLYKYQNQPETLRLENLYEEQSEKNWQDVGGYTNSTEDQKESVRTKNKEYALSIGLNEDGSDKNNRERIEFDSKIDPEHYFKVGYFRSSYNDGGINRILENMGLMGLYEIFNNPDEYIIQPDWEAALENVKTTISELDKKGNYRCFDISPNVLGGVPEIESEEMALSAFTKEIGGQKSSFDAYSNKTGHYFQKEPLKVFALMPGFIEFMGRQIPCTYVISEGQNEWYSKALKIVQETIEYVIAQPDKEKYFLHWSS